MREVQAKFKNPLSFWSQEIMNFVHFKGFFLNLWHVNIVLNSVLRYKPHKPHPGKQHSVQLPWFPKDINLALEWTMYKICSKSTWWKQLLTAAIMCQHEKKLFESVSYSEVHLWDSSFFLEQRVSNRKCAFDETFFALEKHENKYNSKKYNYVSNTSFSDLY